MILLGFAFIALGFCLGFIFDMFETRDIYNRRVPPWLFRWCGVLCLLGGALIVTGLVSALIVSLE